MALQLLSYFLCKLPARHAELHKRLKPYGTGGEPEAEPQAHLPCRLHLSETPIPAQCWMWHQNDMPSYFDKPWTSMACAKEVQSLSGFQSPDSLTLIPSTVRSKIWKAGTVSSGCVSFQLCPWLGVSFISSNSLETLEDRMLDDAKEYRIGKEKGTLHLKIQSSQASVPVV